jgi:glucan 1,3-beta-glucosidase
MASKYSWLVDFHAAPGAQNKYDHSGTPSNQCHFWEGNNPEATVRVLQAIALEIHNKVNIVGLGLMNEPDNNDQLQGWYESAMVSVRGALSSRVGDGPPPSDFPIFIDDARDPNWYSQLVGKQDDFVVMDRHIYRCFTPHDKQLSGEQHAAAIRGQARAELKKLHVNAHGNVIIGEWSAGLNPEGMPHGADAGEQDRQRRVFVQAQREVFNENCPGYFFWTYKKERGWDAGWSSRDASTAAILPEWVGGPRGPFDRVDDEERESLLKKATGWFICAALELGCLIVLCYCHRATPGLLVRAQV